MFYFNFGVDWTWEELAGLCSHAGHCGPALNWNLYFGVISAIFIDFFHFIAQKYIYR